MCRDGEQQNILVKETFQRIAPCYDFLNGFFSCRRDRAWRRALIEDIPEAKQEKILDLCTGTGEVALEIAKKYSQSQIVGVDLSSAMLGVAKAKVVDRGYGRRVVLQEADGFHLPFDNNSFDVVFNAFGIRNQKKIHRALEEMQRVLKPGGIIRVMEFVPSQCTDFPMLFGFYLRRIMPLLAKIFAKSKESHEYLAASIEDFLTPGDFIQTMKACGFKEATAKPLTAKIAYIYQGIKGQ